MCVYKICTYNSTSHYMKIQIYNQQSIGIFYAHSGTGLMKATFHHEITVKFTL